VSCVVVRVRLVVPDTTQEPKGANVSKGKHPSVVFGDWEAQTKVTNRRRKYSMVQRLPYGTRPPARRFPASLPFASLTPGALQARPARGGTGTQWAAGLSAQIPGTAVAAPHTHTHAHARTRTHAHTAHTN
jgi:hypothetical protein